MNREDLQLPNALLVCSPTPLGRPLDAQSRYLIARPHTFSLHMHAKPSFAQRLQTAKMASSRTSAQNNGPRVQKNGPLV